MKSKLFVAVLALSAIVAVVPVASAKKESKEAKLVKQAKITMAEARKTALGRVAGNIEEAKLEREKGKVLFEFEIHNAQNKEVIIHVDAVSGEISEVEEKSGSGSAKEAEIFRQVKISMDDAEVAALQRVAGNVVMAKLERERGKILYEFEIIGSDDKETMVHVDAVTGQVESVD